MFEYFPDLIINDDFCSQGVVSVPLLSEGQAVFWPLVFSFQAACNFAGISVGRTNRFEFLQGTIPDIHKQYSGWKTYEWKDWEIIKDFGWANSHKKTKLS